MMINIPGYTSKLIVDLADRYGITPTEVIMMLVVERHAVGVLHDEGTGMCASDG